jgi:hypothetical protein
MRGNCGRFRRAEGETFVSSIILLSGAGKSPVAHELVAGMAIPVSGTTGKKWGTRFGLEIRR